jgi:hypothetical protein
MEQGHPSIPQKARFAKTIHFVDWDRFLAASGLPAHPTPGQWCSIVNRDSIPALPAAGWFGGVLIRELSTRDSSALV